jgi:DNA-3-methyladenine glycosylase I
MEMKTSKRTLDYKDHTAPWECTYAKEEKSRCRPGKRPKSDKEYFEILSLCVLQAGLGWGMVRKGWPKYKRGFLNFKIPLLADAEVEVLLGRPGMIKNRKKVMAIVNNAKELQKIVEDHGSFSNFLNSLQKGEDAQAIEEITRRFDHLGEHSAEYFLHSVGFWD